MQRVELALRNRLSTLEDKFFAAYHNNTLPAFFTDFTDVATQLSSASKSGQLSEDFREYARSVTTPIVLSATALVRQQEAAAVTRESVVADAKAITFRDLEDFYNNEDEEELPDTNWEALRDWFLVHLAHPFPTPSQCRRLIKECHVDPEELDDWFERMRDLTGWNELYSSWAGSDPHRMKELMKLARKEIDLAIPEHRRRTSPIQRVELEQLLEAVQMVYKPGPSDWWAQLDSIINDSDEESDGDIFSDDNLMGPPSDDDDDAQELVTLEPNYSLDTFFDAAEMSITTSIRPSISPLNPATITVVAKDFPASPPMNALQREGLEWLDKLDRAEAKADAAYAEVERITTKLENDRDKSVVVKLEAAEARFEEAREMETELAIAALRRVQILQAQAYHGELASQPTEPVLKEECVEPVILLEVNSEPTVKSEVVEEVFVSAVKVEVDLKSDAIDPEVAPAKMKTKAPVEITVEPLVKVEPSLNVKNETKAENDVQPGIIENADPDTSKEPELKVGVKSEPSLTLKTNLGATVKIEHKVKEEPDVKSEVKDEPTSSLILPKSEPDTVVFGTFQPLEPEEIEELVASFAPLLVTIAQLDPGVIIVPAGLINLTKSETYAPASEEPEVVMKAEPAQVDLNDELVTVPILFSLEEVVSPPASSSMFPQVQIVLDPSTTPATPASKLPIPPIVPATPRRTRGHPRRTSSRLVTLPHIPLRFASVSSTSSASGYYSGSSACSSDSELGDSTIPTSSPVASRSRPLPPSRRTKASPPQLSPTSPSQRKRKRGREEEPSPYDPSNPSASRPLKRLRGFKRDQHEEEGVHPALCTDFVPPPLPKVSMVSESRKTKRKRREEEEEELRVIKRARVLCHVNAMQEDSIKRPCHSMAALLLNPALASQPSPKLEKVSGLPVVLSTPITLEAIEEKLRVAVEDGPHPIVEEIKNLSLEALALMTDLEFSALICSPESWELRCLEYEPNEDLFEDSPTPHPEPTKVLLALPSPPMSAVVALPPAENIARDAPSEVEKLVETTSTAPAEIVVKQEPIEPVLGLALAPVLPSTIETVPERIYDAPSIAASTTNAKRSDRCGTPSLMDDSLSTRPRSSKPTPAPLVRRTRTKRAVGMMDILSLSGERVSPTLKDASDLFKYEAEEEDWKMEREPYSFPARPYKNDGRRVPRGRESEGSWVPFMDYRQSVRYHPDDGG